MRTTLGIAVGLGVMGLSVFAAACGSATGALAQQTPAAGSAAVLQYSDLGEPQLVRPAQPQAAAECPGNPDALGVSRTITVSSKEYERLGLMQYRTSLPLNDHEVVLTFDDGPIKPYTDRVLDALAHHCVKATFFLVGEMAAAYPDVVRRIHDEGHTIGNHTQHHLFGFEHVSTARAEQEISSGSRTIASVLGKPDALSTFFRIPGLGRTTGIEKYAEANALSVWSADAVADDWTRISSNQVLTRALSRLEERRKGILLLHDIQPRTVLMLPMLLTELRRRNFRIVHVVPEEFVQPPAVTPETPVADRVAPKLGWPRVATTGSELPKVPTSSAAHPEVSADVTGAIEGAESPRVRRQKTRRRHAVATAAVSTPSNPAPQVDFGIGGR